MSPQRHRDTKVWQLDIEYSISFSSQTFVSLCLWNIRTKSKSKILNRSSHSELKGVALLPNTKRYSRHGPVEVTIDTRRIQSKINAEGCIQNRHDNLQLHTGAHAQS